MTKVIWDELPENEIQWIETEYRKHESTQNAIARAAMKKFQRDYRSEHIRRLIIERNWPVRDRKKTMRIALVERQSR